VSKMKSALCLVLVAALVAAGAAERLYPTFAFSGAKHLAHKNHMMTGVMGDSDLSSMHKKMFRLEDKTASPHAELVAEDSQPEVVAVFVTKDMNTEAVARHGARMQGLKHRMENSESSFTAPYTRGGRGVGTSRMWANRLATETAQQYGDEAVYSLTTNKRIAGTSINGDLKGFFTEKKQIFTNGNTELVIVELSYDESMSHGDNIEEQDKAISAAADALHEATSGNYVAVVVSADSTDSDSDGVLSYALYMSLSLFTILIYVLYLWVGQGVTLVFVVGFLLLVLVVLVYTMVAYVTTIIMTGVIAGVIILVLAGFGIINMAALQPPQKY